MHNVKTESTLQNLLNASVLLLALMLLPIEALGQVHSVHQKRVREAVAIDCDTALTSDLRIVRRPYRFSDNLFMGMSAGINRPLSTEANSRAFFPMVRPNAEFHVGKYFTPWISASLNLGYAMQQEVFPALIDTTYSFHSIALSLEGQLCLNRLFTRYRSTEKFLIYALAGAGLQSTFGFDKKNPLISLAVNTSTHFAPLFHAGAMIEIRATEKTSLILRGLWKTGLDGKLCGMVGDHRHQNVELSIGFIKRLANHYASRSFENCRGNEIYYFRELEDHLLDDHQRQLKQYHKGKAPAPVMAAEQDTILIFPCGYPYLTQRQEAKLDLAAHRLALNPHLTLVIDLYPIVADDPKMTPAQSVQRSEVAIRHYLTKHKMNPVNINQLQFQQHPDQESPIGNQSIWIHGAFLHYQQ